MISFRSRCLVALSVLFFAAAGWSAEYYVSPSGDDSNNGKAASSPWRSIAKANSAVEPGDVVYLRGGKYKDDPIKPGKSGTSSSPIRYQAYENETPVITSDKVGGVDVAIQLSNRSYIIVDGLHIDGVEPNPRARVDHFASIFNGHYNTISNGSFRFATGWHGIRLTEGAHHNKLLNNVMDVVGVYDDGNGQDWGDTIQIKRDSHHNVVEGNVITRGAHNLLQVQGDYNIIRGNTFDNDWSEILGPGKGGRNLGLMGRYNVFEGNIVRNSAASTDRASNAGMKAEGQHNIVRHNIVLTNSHEGVTSQARDGQPWAHYNHIYHNTIYGNAGPAWGLVWYTGGNGVVGNVFKNNIVFFNRRVSGRGDADIVFQLQNNPYGVIGESQIESNLIAGGADNDAFLSVKSGGGIISLSEAEEKFAKFIRNNIARKPAFVAANPSSRKDFELAPGSRGIDEGAPLTHTKSGGSGKVVPVDDAGYFTDGHGITHGDRVRIGDGPLLTVVAVDYSAAKITVNQSTSWSDKSPVSLDFSGAAPDIGALESGETEEPAPPRVPRPPTAFTGSVL